MINRGFGGSYMSELTEYADQLHPTRKAYQLRAPIIRPFLEQIAKP